MEYIIMDLEFNQYYNFDEPSRQSGVNKKMRFEIIQIGAIKLDDDFNTVGKFDAFIKPTIYTRMHPFVQKVTGLNESCYADAPHFPAVFKSFEDFVFSSHGARVPNQKRAFCVWGGSDFQVLCDNIKFHELKTNIFSLKFVDVQNLATRDLGLFPQMAIGLNKASELYSVTEDLDFHNAYNDCHYVAKILPKVKFDRKDFREIRVR